MSFNFDSMKNQLRIKKQCLIDCQAEMEAFGFLVSELEGTKCLTQPVEYYKARINNAKLMAMDYQSEIAILEEALSTVKAKAS